MFHESQIIKYKDSEFRVTSIEHVVDVDKLGERFRRFNPGVTQIDAYRIMEQGVPEINERVELYCMNGNWTGFLYTKDNRFVICSYNGLDYYYMSEENFDMNIAEY